MTMVNKESKYTLLYVADPEAWTAWLEEHHASSTGVRLQIAKKGASRTTPSYSEALDCALCYGWIDSQKESYDGEFYIQRFGPRSSRSIWSQVNKDKVERLIAGGRMMPAGLRAIEQAKANGQWDAAYAPQSENHIPEDLEAALNQNSQAKAFFETLNRTNRFAITFRLQNAKKPETRKKRLDQFIAMLEAGEKIYP